MSYVDGFLIALPKANIEAYRKMAELGREVWMSHGALAYAECLADDVSYGELTSFPRAVQAKEDETVVFSWIVYRDRAHRDDVNSKVMNDPRMAGAMNDAPFDGKRMIFGGFEMVVES
ncbi:DUF1428 domain-containing protein [Ollibium composti]|uniref:DUF1428 family protein n=1 Tax=Ollibium composti TaxID=2675109 RepID=A0ABY2Q581_9HYPH|nr:DUF1428 family protein [Mesorhizobium composti]THF56046.1 DUF1428 family protein [Mesorhizobium composti]